MTFAFTAPMVALGTYAVQAASTVDGAMRNINSILGLSEEKFQSLSARAFDFAKTTRAGVTPALEALYEVFSAGVLDQEKAMALWEAANKVSEAGLADLTATTNAMTATMLAYNLSTEDATRIGNVWTRMVQIGVGSLGEFVSGASKVLSASNNLGISLEDMGATIAFLSQATGSASKAETAYSQVLTNILKPSQAATDAFKELGVASGSELIAKFGSVAAAVKALGGVTDEISFGKIFSKTGLEGALILKNNFEAATKAAEDFNNSLDTATMDAWNQQSKSFGFQWDSMKTSLEAVAVVIGQAIMPLITPLINGFSTFLQKIVDLNPEVLQLGVMFIGAIAAAAPMVWLLTSLLNPIGLVISGVVTLAAAFATNFNGIRDTVLKAVEDITGGLQPLKDTFDTFMAELFPKSASDILPDAPVDVDFDNIVRINPPKGSPPISLYDFYDNEGFSDVVSWDDFMKMATKGGWTGGAIKAGDIISLDMSGVSSAGAKAGTTYRDSFKDKMHDMFGGMGAGDQAQSATLGIFERLKNAIAAAWPKLQGALNTMWGNFTNWVKTTAIPAIDTAGGTILNAVAGWFDTSNSNFKGDGQVYDVLTGIMRTDVAGAASDAGGLFAKALPQLTAAMQRLLGDFGRWIEAEGAPTLSRSVGFMAGRIVSLIRGALATAIQAVTGIKIAGATDMAKTAVIDPLFEGIAEGVGSNTTNPFLKLTDSLSGMLVLALGAWAIAPSAVGLIAKPILGVITTALIQLPSSTGVLGALARMTAGLGAGMMTALGALSVLGIGAIIIGALLSNEDVQRGLAAWAGVWDNIKLIAGIAADRIAVGLRMIKRDLENTMADLSYKVNVAKLVVNSGDTAASDAAYQAGNTMVGIKIARGLEDGIAAYLAGAPLPVDLNGIIPTLQGQAGNPVATQALLDSITDPTKLTQALKVAIDKGDQAAMQILVPAQIAYDLSLNPIAPIETTITQLMEQTGLSPEQIGHFLTGYYAAYPAMVDQIPVAVGNVKIALGAGATTDTSAITNDSDWISRAVANSGKKNDIELPVDAKPIIGQVDEATKTWADTVVKTLPSAITTAVAASGGDMTAASDSMTKPFVTAFQTAFGESGTVTAQWHSFLTTYVTDVQSMQTTTTDAMPQVQSAVVTAFDTMQSSVLQLNDALEVTANKLNALIQNSPYTMTVKVVTEGDVPAAPAGSKGTGKGVDGTHAMGLARVPHDNYIAALHKGERVLTAKEAANYDPAGAVPKASASGGNDNSTAVINIYGVQDFDQFLKEAKRRGFNLDKFRR